ncbi:MAG: ion transporter [Magnetospirillum sp.]|nr:ion transporter [Magnetospirillum sp.]
MSTGFSLRAFVESKGFQWGTFAVIMANAVTVVAESYLGSASDNFENFFDSIDFVFVSIFTAEIILKIFVYRKDYLKDPWNIFDVLVTCPAWIPALNTLSVARIARVIRLLRLLSAFPSFRALTSAMLRSLADSASIGCLVGLFMFIFGVLAYRLFGEAAPELFGTLGRTLFTLFKVVSLYDLMSTLNALDSMAEIAYPFFIIYFISMAYFVLNFLIAIASFNIYNVMQEMHGSRYGKGSDEPDPLAAELAEIKATLAALMEAQKNRVSAE